MMNREEMLEVINTHNLKRWSIAAKCNIHPSMFSKFLNDSKGGHLSEEQTAKISSYLNQFKHII